VIVRRRPELDNIVPPGGEVAVLADGLTGEGPVWIHERDELVFSDHRESVRYRWSEATGLAVIAEGTEHGNGMTRDLDGNLVVCERGQLVMIDATGARSILADHIDGVPMYFGADPVVGSNGIIYFTGSTARSLEDKGLLPKGDGSVEFVEPKRDSDGNLKTGAFVAMLKPGDRGNAQRLVGDFAVANGLSFSPDQSLLYVIDTRLEHVRTFPVNSDGSLDLERQSIFFEFDRGDLVGLCDGMAVDVLGNLYCAAPGGVWVITSSGEHLGTISVGEHERHTNCGFGGSDWKTLYITTHAALASIKLSVPGIPLPFGRA
jgi:gluconolactonase